MSEPLGDPRPNLDAIEERVHATSFPPWKSDGRVRTWRNGELVAVRVKYRPDPLFSRVRGPVCMVSADDYGGSHRSRTLQAVPDASFIAHSRADVPALCAYIRRLEAAILHSFGPLDLSIERALAGLEAPDAQPEWRR